MNRSPSLLTVIRSISGRSEALFKAIAAMDSSKFVWRGRLGSFARGSRFDVIPLQASDILSYETFRHLEGGGGRRARWQHELLTGNGQVSARVMGRHFFQRLVFNMNNYLKTARRD
jgi:hypothetical protein